MKRKQKCKRYSYDYFCPWCGTVIVNGRCPNCGYCSDCNNKFKNIK